MCVLFFSIDPPSMGSESSEEECWRKGSRRGGCRRKIVQLSQKLEQASSHCASISLGASLLQPTLQAGTGGQSLHNSVHKTMVAGVHLKLVEFVKIEKILLNISVQYQASQIASLLPAARWSIEYVEPEGHSRANGQAGEMSLKKTRHRPCLFFFLF